MGALRETIDGWLATVRPVQIVGGIPGGRGAAPGGGAPTRGGAAVNGTSTMSSAQSAGADEELTIIATALTPALAPNTRLRLYVDADDSTPERGLAIEYPTPQNTAFVRQELDSTVTSMRAPRTSR